MKLLAETKYALRAMLELGLHYNEKPILLKDVAMAQSISLRYLEHIFSILKNRGLINSMSKGKGYVLNKPPSRLLVYDIVTAFESYNLVECINTPGICERTSSCGTRLFWNKLSSVLRKELLSVSLADIIKGHKRLNVSKKVDKKEHNNHKVN